MNRPPSPWRTGARALLATALFAYPASLIVAPVVPGTATAIMLVGSLALLPFAVARRAELAQGDDYAPIVALFAFLVINAGAVVAWHAPTWLLINYGRLFAALGIAAAIRLLEPPEWVFYAGCAVGAFLAGAVALWEIVGDGVGRASGPEVYFGWRRATIFGGLAVVLAFVPILAEPDDDWPLVGRMLLALGLAGGITAALLSASRGAWLAASVLALWRVGRARPWAAIALAAVIVAASLLLPGVAERWNAALFDVLTYGDGRGETSVGLRFHMWKAALAAFAEHPWIGVGPLNFDDVLAARVEAGLGPPLLAGFDHAHSDALHALATGGIVAFAAYACAFWLPWRYFRRIAATRPAPAARGGMALVVAFLILGLSDTMFVHRIALSFYVIGVVVLMGFAGMPAARAAERGAPIAVDERRVPATTE